MDADRAELRPRYSMQRRMIVWTLALVIVPMAFGGFWLNWIAHESLVAQHREAVEQLGDTAAAALASRVNEGWSRAASNVVGLLSLDPRVAFVVVYDADGQILHKRVIDPAAWTLYEAALAAGAEESGAEPLQLDRHGMLMVRRTPIWDAPWPGFALETGDGRRLDGEITLAMYDRSMPAALDRLRAAQLGAMAVIALIALPVVVLAVRRWTAPLRRLMVASRDLAANRRPEHVPAATDDEVGLLARQFNDMANTLADTYGQLEFANEQLERKVRDRTAELSEVNQRLADEIRDKNDLLRAVSHDLGAPVRNIVGLVNLLLRRDAETLSDAARARLERVTANARLQIEMIDELLELSRLRVRPGRREPVRLADFVPELAASLGYDLERAGVHLVIEEALPTLLADRGRVRQVFQNLLENAVKYMLENRQRRIVVRCQPRASHYHFSVADTGRGIHPDDAQRVFQPFQRGHNQTTPPVSLDGEVSTVPGRGLGLASVKSIVESWGGRIWIESQPGEGSTFHFTAAYEQVGSPAPAMPAVA
ncbi:MAG: HAMP domain-containing sensor histidine kinase [Phycisphaeraceae bacterium]